MCVYTIIVAIIYLSVQVCIIIWDFHAHHEWTSYTCGYGGVLVSWVWPRSTLLVWGCGLFCRLASRMDLMCSPGTMAMLRVLGCLAHTGEFPLPLPCWSNSPTNVNKKRNVGSPSPIDLFHVTSRAFHVYTNWRFWCTAATYENIGRA